MGEVGAVCPLPQKNEAKATVKHRRRPKQSLVSLHGMQSAAKPHGEAIPDPPFFPQGIPRRGREGRGIYARV